MARRGRKPSDPENPKAGPVSIRFAERLLGRLKDAARRDGRPLTEEISRRLERSFVEEARAAEAFGGHHTYAFFLLLAQAFKTIRRETGQCWHRDPFAFAHAEQAVAETMHYFRPRGRQAVPRDMPLLEWLRDISIRGKGPKKTDFVAQARTYPFGFRAARLALLNLSAAPREGEEATPEQKIFQQLAVELRPHLARARRNSVRSPLARWRRARKHPRKGTQHG